MSAPGLRALDTHPGDGELKRYWLHGEGAAKWKTWTQLYHHLLKYLNPEFAKRTAAQWFHERYGFWPGDKKNRSSYGAVALSDDGWINEHVRDVLEHGLPPLPPTVDEQLRGFNPLEARDDDGKWTDGPGGAATGALKDALKLAEKIQLDDNEHLIGSSKLDGDAGGIRMALTDQSDKHFLRLGIGGEGYGQRNRDEGIAAWDGNPTRASLSSADRKRLSEESDALDVEYESASPDRQTAIDDRQAAILEQLTGDDQGFNGTAKLDEYSIGRLVDRIRPALAEAIEQEKAENDAYARLETLKASGNVDHAQMARLREIARLDSSNVLTFTEGVIPGSAWGDVHYELYLDDTSVGPELSLGVKPKGAPDNWGDNLDWQGTFDAAEIKKFLRLLDKYRSVPR
jgi:hypothetical protein